MGPKITLNTLSNFEKEEQSWRDHDTWQQCNKKRDIDQMKRIENLEINPYLKGQLIFDKGGKSMQWSKQSLQ